MNAQVNIELADFMKSWAAQGITKTIRKVDMLRYYRENQQAFINLGGLLISQTDGRFYLFNKEGELVGMDRIPIESIS